MFKKAIERRLPVTCCRQMVLLDSPATSRLSQAVRRDYAAFLSTLKPGETDEETQRALDNRSPGMKAEAERNEQLLKDHAKNKKWGQCPDPKCRIIVERVGGCRAVVCRICSTTIHFRDSSSPPGGPQL